MNQIVELNAVEVEEVAGGKIQWLGFTMYVLSGGTFVMPYYEN